MRKESPIGTFPFLSERYLEAIEFSLGCAEGLVSELLLGRPLTPGLAQLAQRRDDILALRELIASRGSRGSNDPDDPNDPNTSTKALSMRTRFNNRLSVLEREHESDFTIVVVMICQDPITGKDEVTVTSDGLELSGRDAEIWLQNNPTDIVIFDNPTVTFPKRDNQDTLHENTIQ